MGRPRKEEATLTISKSEALTGQPDVKPGPGVSEVEKILQPKQESRCDLLAERVQILTEDIREIHQEFSEFVALLGNSFGEPMKTKAAAIALRYKK